MAGETAINGEEQSARSGKANITFANQDKLPKLPIPSLESTAEKYLNALKPLQTAREHQDTIKAVKDFLRKDGPELNERLKKYASDKTSYIEQFWYDSFLNFDNPVVLNLNPFFLLEDDPTPARNNQVTRAASLVVSALCFIRAVRREELPPDTVKGRPLCMYQFSRLFGSARVPTEDGCHILQDDTAKHIVVLCRGQFYWFDVLDDNSDLITTEKDLALNLEAIVADAGETSEQDAARGALGVLSTENRKVWAGLRAVLTRDPAAPNAACLRTVDTALFVLCLDATEPGTAAALCRTMLCGRSAVRRGLQTGTCTNRWYDKLQVVVCANGSAGINFEHTGVDGHTVLRFASDVYTDTILRFARSINGQAPSLWASAGPDPGKRDPKEFGGLTRVPHKLEWEVGPQLATALRFAETRLADLIAQTEFATLEFAAYGKAAITAAGLSPDAYVQLAFQAAYYGLYGRADCAYEPAMTKAFLHGRTEAVRSVTPESVRFVQTFWGEHPAEVKVTALKAAAERHVAITKECSQARGQDRHLYALFCVWQRALDADGDRAAAGGRAEDNAPEAANGTQDTVAAPDADNAAPLRPSTQMPALFADAGWDRLNTTVLSTSNCGNPALRHFGFGPVSGDGFGLGYIIKEGSLSVCAASRHRQTQRFVDALEGYLLEVRRLLRQVQRQQQEKGSGGEKAAAEEEAPARSAPDGVGRGRAISRSATGVEQMASEGDDESDDGLGGYGFFDSGLLQQALKASTRGKEDAAENDVHAEEPPHVQARRAVGKKLRLAEY